MQRKKGFNVHYTIFGGGVGASWLVLAPLDRTVRVLVLAGGGRGHSVQGVVEILPVASCYRNEDKLRPGGPLRSYAVDFTYTNFILSLLL